MRHFWEIFSYELRRNSRRRGFLFVTFGVPFIGYLLMFAVQVIGSAAGATTIPTSGNPADMAATAMEQLDAMGLDGVDAAGFVDQTGQFTVPESLAPIMTQYADEQAAQAALNAGEIELYYLIPSDYIETGDVTIVMPRLVLGNISPEPARQLVLSNLAQEVDPGIYARLINPANFEIVNLALTNSENQSEDAAFIIIYIFAIILMISLFLTNGYLMQSVIEEKETRLIEILVSAVQPWQLLGGKILALGVLGLMQMIVWVSALLIAGQITSSGSMGSAVGVLATIAHIQVSGSILPLLLIYYILAYLMFAALYGAVGALSNSMREGPQYSVIFILPAVAPLWFLPVFVSNPDGALAVFLSLFPLTSPIAMTQRLVISPVPDWQVILSIVFLILGAFGAMWFAGRLFRVQTLLAGQMPKLRDFPKLLRG